MLGKDYPNTVYSSGGHIAYDDDREVPDTLVTTYEFDDTIMTFEMAQFTRYIKKLEDDVRDGDKFPHWPQTATRIEFYGTEYQMYLARHGGGYQVFTKNGEIVEQEYGRRPEDMHRGNFIDCIRSREKPNADIEEGHRSACLIHLASLSLRVGSQKLLFDKETKTFTNSPEANKLVKRTYREPYVIPEEI